MELKEVKSKIGSVKNISELTSSLETFSALKMKKTQKRFLESAPFSKEMARMLKNMENSLRENRSIFLEERNVKNVLVCVVASDRGFCGSFNSNVIKLADKEIAKLRANFEVEILPIGKKAVGYYERRENIKYKFFGVGDYWRFRDTKDVTDFLISSFLNDKYQEIRIIYTHFYSSFLQKPKSVKLFPLGIDIVSSFIKEEGDVDIRYKLEPSPRVILDEVIPVFAQYLVYQYILSANTSEHSSRMMAMRSASDSARGLLEELRLVYNKARQEQITSEVCEISSTKEVMD
ncbi:MAG: ATP synthase gamma chain [Parcubacteria group bacterium ADurb.Bin247]|jgi:F-type H+-transporting ATPase subunit gamma|nr:MAG: ATP synthase gamma chain [Parcubacteria group bacterium ADurb.Bin247]